MVFFLAYPIGSDGGKTENSNASHQWFVGNRQVEGSDGRGTKPAFTYVLPDIPMESSSIPALPALEKRKENKK